MSECCLTYLSASSLLTFERSKLDFLSFSFSFVLIEDVLSLVSLSFSFSFVLIEDDLSLFSLSFSLSALKEFLPVSGSLAILSCLTGRFCISVGGEEDDCLLQIKEKRKKKKKKRKLTST